MNFIFFLMNGCIIILQYLDCLIAEKKISKMSQEEYLSSYAHQDNPDFDNMMSR